jgi:hypothetical protein
MMRPQWWQPPNPKMAKVSLHSLGNLAQKPKKVAEEIGRQKTVEGKRVFQGRLLASMGLPVVE